MSNTNDECIKKLEEEVEALKKRVWVLENKNVFGKYVFETPEDWRKAHEVLFSSSVNYKPSSKNGLYVSLPDVDTFLELMREKGITGFSLSV